MGERYLIDSNIAIYILNGSIPENAKGRIAEFLKSECNLSIITKIEVLGWQFPSLDSQTEAEAFMNASNVMGLTPRIADLTIDLRRKYKIKLPDAVIAATALSLGFILVSRNTADFSKIEELEFINPFV